MKRLTTDHLRTIVPATQPAWLYVAVSWESSEDDGSLIPEWNDAIFPVLAYATAPGGYGAWMISLENEGPMWVLGVCGDETSIVLHVGEKPERGPQNRPKTFEPEKRYCPEDDCLETITFELSFVFSVDAA